MELANGDSLEGEVTSIQDGVITMKTPLGEVKLPVARLRTVALKKVDLESCHPPQWRYPRLVPRWRVTRLPARWRG